MARWIEVGVLRVDAGMIFVTDFAITERVPTPLEISRASTSSLASEVPGRLGLSGFAITTGYGDGTYPVEILTEDFDGATYVKAMRVKFIEEEDYDDAEWESLAIDPDELRTLALENDELNSLLQEIETPREEYTPPPVFVLQVPASVAKELSDGGILEDIKDTIWRSEVDSDMRLSIYDSPLRSGLLKKNLDPGKACRMIAAALIRWFENEVTPGADFQMTIHKSGMPGSYFLFQETLKIDHLTEWICLCLFEVQL